MSLASPEAASLDRPIKTPGQLLVEGRSAEIFLREMVEYCALSGVLEVRTYGSKQRDSLLTYLELFTAKPAFKERVRALGIIRDAEDKPAASAFDSVRDVLQQVHLPSPNSLTEFAPGPPRVGVFILPNGQTAGMLETLCWDVVCENSAAVAVSARDCVSAFLNCLGGTPSPPANQTKARLGAYLISQGVYEAQVGRAAQQGLFAWDSSRLGQLRTFLSDVARGAPQ